MAVFAIESYAARLRIVKTWAADGSPAETGDDALISFLRIGLAGFPRRLIDEVGEIVLLRNALAHNHVWLMRGTDELESFRSDAVQALLRREDRLFRQYATAAGDRTQRLDLNLVPEYVGYGDARTVLSVLVRTLDALAAFDVENMPLAPDLTIFRIPEHRTLRSFLTGNPGRSP